MTLTNKKRILCFHDVLDSDIFESRLLLCKKLGFQFISLAKLLDNKTAGPALAVTFDDGYQSVYQNALPILRKLHIPATFFITNDFIGLKEDALKSFLKNNLLRSSYREPMSWEEVGKIASDPLFEIGAHTASHPRLNDKYPKELAEKEIIEAGDNLEKKISKKIRYFAFPFGDSDSAGKAARSLVRTRYEAAFSIIPGKISGNETDTSFLPRHSLDPERNILVWLFHLLFL
ncbi:MAG: polysaccharide deacetylase family protein [Candidatus Harrisonbacteria bacterium]|nr:polysaccharide deacetylase family protein [Candidatus Harrisonbacteria bacterium]